MGKERLSWTIHEGPIGPLTVVAAASGITNIHFSGTAPRLPQEARRPLPEVAAQLDAYFGGEMQGFDLDLDLHGAPLQRAVWERLLEIPYGKTTTYGGLARALDESLYPAGVEPHLRARVVGQAVGRNPVPVLVPCHRVIGADGSLTGYFGGLERKRVLLELEGWSGVRKSAVGGRAEGQLALGVEISEEVRDGEAAAT
ncbi:MAG: methylated-DNA--[protein]-cysteine S-methyltransferase [Solirubrobacterales bacterium]|nr:methylated-DNA--[protein]-cysteine S-methyltransferase [Solirubrobacterales bacterium]